MNLGAAGGTSKTVTDSLEQFPLHQMPGFDKLKFALYGNTRHDAHDSTHHTHDTHGTRTAHARTYARHARVS